MPQKDRLSALETSNQQERIPYIPPQIETEELFENNALESDGKTEDELPIACTFVSAS